MKQTTKKSATGKNRRRTALIAAAILAIFVVHFAWQFSFVQKENLRIAEDSLNNARLEIAPAADGNPLEKEKINAAETESTAIETVKEKSGEEKAKVIVPVKYAPLENKISAVVYEKTAREPRSTRLRRAEKLLTGF